MQQIYLVTIDSSALPRTINYEDSDGMRNARSATLAPGIQNFYFIMANDAAMAKRMVIATFRAKPLVAEDVSRCITATPLTQITKLLSQRNNTWSYIPIGGVRAAGQQGHNDTMRQLSKMQEAAGTDNAISHTQWNPPPPITYDAQVVEDKDLKNVGGMSEAEARISKGAPPSAGGMTFDPTKPMSPEQMQQMMLMLQMQMQQQNEPPVDTTKHSPAQEPELAERIRANMTSGPKPEDPSLSAEEQAEIARLDAVAAQAAPSAPAAAPAAPVPMDESAPAPAGWDDDLTSVKDDDATSVPPNE